MRIQDSQSLSSASICRSNPERQQRIQSRWSGRIESQNNVGHVLVRCWVRSPLFAQSTVAQTDQQSSKVQTSPKKKGHSPGGDVARGTGDIAKGAAGAAGHAAAGVGKGAVDLVTLHPIDAAGDVGKGAVYAGKDAGVGSRQGNGQNR